MEENLIEAQYDVTKKSRLVVFYRSYKKLIISLAVFLFILLISIISYSSIKDKKKIQLSENYLKAKTYIELGNVNKGKNILKEIIYSNDKTYSTLSLFLILDNNLVNEKDLILSLFDHLLSNNKFDKELKNLIIFKLALFESNFVNEYDLLETIKPLISSETIWKPHALLLVGDFFTSKKQYKKAREFYEKLLSLKDISPRFYEQARSQLTLNSNE